MMLFIKYCSNKISDHKIRHCYMHDQLTKTSRASIYGLDLGDEIKIKTVLFLTTVLRASKIPLPSQT